MLDDLRNSSAFIEEEEPVEEVQTPVRSRLQRSRSHGGFMGMTAVQRFLISVMLFMMIFILGVIALIATGSIYLPF